MTPQSFTAWVQRRERAGHGHVPDSDRIVPLIAQAGSRGMTRREVGHAVRLEPDDLNHLLDALVRFGLLVVGRESGVPVYRARLAAAGLPTVLPR
jgi:hypothetical protein